MDVGLWNFSFSLLLKWWTSDWGWLTSTTMKQTPALTHTHGLLGFRPRGKLDHSETISLHLLPNTWCRAVFCGAKLAFCLYACFGGILLITADKQQLSRSVQFLVLNLPKYLYDAEMQETLFDLVWADLWQRQFSCSKTVIRVHHYICLSQIWTPSDSGQLFLQELSN